MADPDSVVIPVTEEVAEVGTREVEHGRVRIDKRVDTVREQVQTVMRRTDVQVERRRVDRWLADGETPVAREEDGLLIVPVVEEVPVVQLRRRLAEEVVIRREVSEVPAAQEVQLRRDHVSVDRIGPEARSAAGDFPTPSGDHKR